MDPAFRKEARLTKNGKILPDASATKKIKDVGIDTCKRQVSRIVPGETKFYSTACVEDKVVQKHGGTDSLLDDATRLICTHKGRLDDVACIKLILGSKNPYNMIPATQAAGNPFGSVDRTPVLKYDDNDRRFKVLPATESQARFARKADLVRAEELKADKKTMKNRVNKFKKIHNALWLSGLE